MQHACWPPFQKLSVRPESLAITIPRRGIPVLPCRLMSARVHNQQAVDLARSLDDCFCYPPIQSMDPTIATPSSLWRQAKQQVMSLPRGPVSPYNTWFDLVEGVTYPTINTCLDYVRGIKALICSDSLYSVFPIARSAAEGFAYVGWVWQSGLALEQRIHRAALLHHHTLTQEGRRLREMQQISGIDRDAQDSVAADLRRSEQHLQQAVRDLDAAKRHVPSCDNQLFAPKRLPPAADVVSRLLGRATSSAQLSAIYTELSQMVHPQPAGVIPLIPKGLPAGAHPNIALGTFLMPVHVAVTAMFGCLSDVAQCLGLDDPRPYFKRTFEILAAVVVNDPHEMLFVAS